MIVPGSANALMLGQSSATGYNLTNSLRFRSSASAYLNRTLTSSTNRRISTFSAWVKWSLTGSSSYPELFSAAPNGSTYADVFYFNNNVLTINFNGGVSYSLSTTQVFRDPSAWYHIVLAVDTTQATASNRVKLYVNGVQVTAFSTANYPTQNYDPNFNSAISHNIGRSTYANDYFDGYMAEVNFIDGQALTPSSFGENNATTGVWQPKRYTGTYGTNGFYLPFTNTTSTTTLGYDFSGNSNNWTTNNFSLTAGSTYDSMTDVPTLTSATTANYCVLNPLAAANPVTITNGNLAISCGNGSTYGNTIGTMAIPSSGKYYIETVCTQNGAQADWGLQSYPLSGTTRVEWYSGTVYYNGTSASAPSISVGDVLGMAIDVTGGYIYLYKNGTLQTTLTYNISGLTLFPFFGTGYSSTIVNYTVNFGQQPWQYTPPTGYVALNTYNLPTSTIVAGNKYMDATLYTGTNATQSVINQGGFKPDFVWMKNRGYANTHVLGNSVAGVSKYLFSNLTDAEQTATAGTAITSYNSNGFTLGTETSTSGSTNASSYPYVAWQWQAGQGTTSSNTNGSITSTVSVNASAGFSIVTYTGTGVAGTIGHGLGVAPNFIVVKNRTTGGTDWYVKHSSYSANDWYQQLNLTSAVNTSSTIWNNTAPTSSVFSVGTSGATNNNGDGFVAYCWAEIAGFSKFGSYTGNGSTDGPFIYTGFRPKFVMFKCTSSTGQWYIMDTSRGYGNQDDYRLYPNLSNAENSGDGFGIDILSNGFKQRTNQGEFNASGGSYIYACFAENPFKNALAR